MPVANISVSQAFMTPSTEWKEVILPGEEQRLEEIGKAFAAIQEARARKHGMGRGLHIKPHAGLKASFTVNADVPEYARVGLFAKPDTYKAYVRFSNGMGLRQDDRTPDVRGIAVKLVGVGGKKVIPPLADAKTQDFLAIQGAGLPISTGEDFAFIVLAGMKPLTLFPKLVSRFGIGGTFRLLKGLAKSRQPPPGSQATRDYFSAVPIKFGPYAVRYKFKALQTDEGPAGDTPDYLSTELQKRISAGPVAFDFQVQFFIDEKQTPIEDAAVDWAAAPFVTLGRLTITQQNPGSPEGEALTKYVESLSFDPWHAQEELRPIGNFMRARNAAYRLSTSTRKAAAEPDGSEPY